MLIEFSVENYRSFHAPVTLSMRAAKLRSGDDSLDRNNTFEAGNLKLLRSAAIYGANASGKSNLIKAMAFMRRFVLQSSKESQAGEPTGVEPFQLSADARGKPSYFQIIFHLGNRRYRYGFQVDKFGVRSEWLYHTAQRETRLFIREGDKYDLSNVFKEGRGLAERTRDNALFLSVVAQFNGPLSKSILDWFRRFNIISGLQDVAYGNFTIKRCASDQIFRRRVVELVREADLGISDIKVDESPLAEAEIPETARKRIEQLVQDKQVANELTIAQITTKHRVYGETDEPVGWQTFDMERQESAGTRKIFYLAGPLLDTLDKGQVLIIDEMEARLHPFITRAVVQLFNSQQTNPHNAQIVFATHDTSLLNKRFFRRDQIWFTEKDRYGATALYSLAELKVRKDASFDKDYVNGKYGAIPFVGGLSALFRTRSNAENT